MGRTKINDEVMPARFPAGTFERMDNLLSPKEKRSDLIRAAVERELGRRERAAKRQGDETEKPD
jgi:metal-responsive CopG/Arc/MetJ family transcriptional regulator